MPKNIVILCDGTWENANNKKSPLTNIGRLRNILTSEEEAVISDIKETSITAKQKIVSLKKTHRNGAQQLIYYHPGVGTGGFWDRLIGGATGKGIDENINGAYRYIAENYQPGDKIYLIGFSRGAYTVRSLAGLIRKGGILPKAYLQQCDKLYELYRTDSNVDSKKAEEFRKKYYCDMVAKIHFMGVFDTVGSLGVPDDIFDDSKRYKFHDTTLSKIIKYAYHALAIDEKRLDFQPTLWQVKKTTISHQYWFIGAHSDVGGGYKENALSNISLQWMLTQAIFRGLLCPISYLPLHGPKDYLGGLHDPSKKFPFCFFRPTILRSVCLTTSDEQIHSTVFERLVDKDTKYKPQNIVCDINKAYLYEDVQPIMHPYPVI